MSVARRADATIITTEDLKVRLFGTRRTAYAPLAGPIATLRLWWQRHDERRRMRRDLATFSEEMLEDFGLTRREAERLARQPFWRA